MTSRYDALPDYVSLTSQFLDGSLSAVEFQGKFMRAFKDETRDMAEPLFLLLDKLFGDVDSFCADPNLLAELRALRPEYHLDEGQLRAQVAEALSEMRLMGSERAPASPSQPPS